jgi:hypothetical protein
MMYEAEATGSSTEACSLYRRGNGIIIRMHCILPSDKEEENTEEAGDEDIQTDTEDLRNVVESWSLRHSRKENEISTSRISRNEQWYNGRWKCGINGMACNRMENAQPSPVNAPPPREHQAISTMRKRRRRQSPVSQMRPPLVTVCEINRNEENVASPPRRFRNECTGRSYGDNIEH